MKLIADPVRTIRVVIIAAQAALLVACGWTVNTPQTVTARVASDVGVVAVHTKYFGDEYADAYRALQRKAVEPLPPTF